MIVILGGREEGEKTFRVGPERWGPEVWGTQNFALFFPSPALCETPAAPNPHQNSTRRHPRERKKARNSGPPLLQGATHSPPTPKKKLAKFGQRRLAKCGHFNLTKCGINQMRFGQMRSRPNQRPGGSIGVGSARTGKWV